MTRKLKNSQIRIAELEKEISTVKNNNEELRKNIHQLQSEYNSLNNRFFELKKEKEDLGLEASELKQKLNLKKTELIAVQQELQEKTALLSLSELRIQQVIHVHYHWLTVCETFFTYFFAFVDESCYNNRRGETCSNSFGARISTN